MSLRFCVVLAIVLLRAPLGLLAGAEWPPPPGVVIAQSPDLSTTFIGSPTLAILPDGTYVAAHDFFGREARGLHSTRVFTSADRGATWTQSAHLKRQFWSTLFVHRGALYLIGTAGEYQGIVIRRSDDGGHTWTNPRDAKSGRLLRGSFACGPVPVVVHHGRIWRCFEEYEGRQGKWSGRYFNAFTLSAPEDADLLDAASWRRTNAVAFDGRWVPGDRTGWLEGNAVVAPDGRIVDILRVHAFAGTHGPMELSGGGAGIPRYEVAAMLNVSDDGSRTDFDPAQGFFRFPGSQSKFTIRRAPRGGRYWAIVNKISGPTHERTTALAPYHQRNVLVLTTSTDLRHWEERCTLLRWREGELIASDVSVGFQYVDWQFDGDDLVAVCRTAWNGDNYHNANYLTFHRVAGFRTLRPEDAPLPLITP